MSAVKEQQGRGILDAARIVRTFAPVMNIKPAYFFIAIFVSFFIALFEGASVGLLAPLMKGIIEKDFTFLKDVSLLEPVIDRFPGIMELTSGTLFLSVIVVIFLTTLLKNVMSYLLGLYLSYHGGIYRNNIRNFIFERYLKFGKLYFDRTSKGHVQRILDYSIRVVNLLDDLIQLLRRVFVGVVYFSIMLYISWQLTLFSLLTFPALSMSVKWLIKRIQATSDLQTEVGMKFGKELFNILNCVTLVKAYSREDETRKKYRDITERQRNLGFSIEKKSRLVQPIQEMITLLAILLMMCAVAFFFVNEPTSDVSVYLLFLILAKKTVPHFAAFNDARSRIAQMRPSISRVLDLLNDEGKAIVSEGKKRFPGLQSAIEFRNINFSYVPEVPVLNDVTFTIPKGKMTALVGPTGAGKTTIINLLMRFYDCEPGKIFVDGTDIREFTSASLREHIALVSQQILLFNDTLKSNLTYGRNGTGGEINQQKLSDALNKARLGTFIERLPQGVDTIVGDGGVNLSGGERQRVSIARALLKESEILFLDEATSALDSRTERLIQEAIEESIRGRTTVVIAHRLSTIKHADNILVVEDGRVVEQGFLKELLDKRGAFYRYWEEQKFY